MLLAFIMSLFGFTPAFAPVDAYSQAEWYALVADEFDLTYDLDDGSNYDIAEDDEYFEVIQACYDWKVLVGEYDADADVTNVLVAKSLAVAASLEGAKNANDDAALDAAVAADIVDITESFFGKIIKVAISKADADAVTEIDIWEYDKITKIDQLEKFPNLVTFKCMYCKVEEAHLSHPNIENIHIRWNNLKKLDLTGLPNLNWITANSNQITEVVIPDNSQITQLDISQNQLTAISIPENNNLSSLGIADNALTTLDLNNCTKLTSLTCGNNNLTQLDVSMLTDLNSVWCQGNRLEELDLSKNKWVFSLNCGNQQENKTLYLKLPDELLDKWESSWKGTANFTNVELYTPKVEEGSGSTGGDNFNGVIL